MRKIGRRVRFAKKKKDKVSKACKKLSTSRKMKAPNQLTVKKKRSALLKKQATERMVLKEHVCDLKKKRQSIHKGADAKTERRDLGKYIRQLVAEQKKKHEDELLEVDGQIGKEKKAQVMGALEQGLDAVTEVELRNMFSHLTS